MLEKCLNYRIFEHIERHKLLHPNRIGFRKGRTIEMVIWFITSVTKEALDEILRVAGVFLDLDEAFDTVDPRILLRKCEFYRLRGATSSLIRNYL